MTKFAALVLLGVSSALLGAGACLAEDTGSKLGAAQPSPDKNAQPYSSKTAPAATRSLHAVPPAVAAPAPAGAPTPKSDSSSSDDTVGGLPGAKRVTDEKQP